jgi:hypothetical protein
MSEPIRNLEDAVAALGALPMPAGSVPVRDVEDELTGARLSLYEEELETARLRLALASAQRGRRELRELVRQMCDGLNGFDCPPPGETPMQLVTRVSLAWSGAEDRVAELEAERKSTNALVLQADVQRQADRDRIAALEALTPARHQTCRVCSAGYVYGEPCSHCEFRARMEAAAQARVRQPYRAGHDLPELGGQR